MLPDKLDETCEGKIKEFAGKYCENIKSAISVAYAIRAFAKWDREYQGFLQGIQDHLNGVGLPKCKHDVISEDCLLCRIETEAAQKLMDASICRCYRCPCVCSTHP